MYMKRYLLILSAFVVLTMICCTGCGNKTAITTEKFSSTMQEKGVFLGIVFGLHYLCGHDDP